MSKMKNWMMDIEEFVDGYFYGCVQSGEVTEDEVVEDVAGQGVESAANLNINPKYLLLSNINPKYLLLSNINPKYLLLSNINPGYLLLSK